MESEKTILLWFRKDLRIQDNSAFAQAIEMGYSIVPVFILDEDAEGQWKPGGASKVFLHEAIASLEKDLAALGLALVVRKGSSDKILEELLKETAAAGVFWNRRYEPRIIRRDSEIKKRLKEAGKVVESFNSSLLWEPWEVATQQGKPFQVFTPFWKNAGSRSMREPVQVDLENLLIPKSSPRSDSLESMGLLPELDWGEKLLARWEVSEEAAHKKASDFLSGPVSAYDTDRDFPGIDGTSSLSAYLHWGLIGPRQVWSLAVRKEQAHTQGGKTFLSEIGWREFAYHVLYHFPQTPERPLRDKYAEFPWEVSVDSQKKWESGETGYPIVDAGMRQLYSEGWMHNRVRMIVASFLVKHLLQPWNAGAKWFWDCLVDADLASNTLGWQWSGGCGADAAPYFRVFNPMTQGKKFDPEGLYVKKYVPELKHLSKSYIHEPWEAPDDELEKAGVELGETYPFPMIEHKEGRERALAAFELVKG
ncbi:MAG: deoxyribodipyrimidine photo-lyase [Verrucomicrobiota bacterium]